MVLDTLAMNSVNRVVAAATSISLAWTATASACLKKSCWIGAHVFRIFASLKRLVPASVYLCGRVKSCPTTNPHPTTPRNNTPGCVAVM